MGGVSRGAQIGSALRALDELFSETKPAAVVVQGDTNSAAAGSLAANALGIPLVHVEAGLRSFDRRMPEEHNRVIADHLADLLCAPTATSRSNLLAEINGEHIVLTGNTVVEAVTSLLPPPTERRSLLAEFGLEPGEFVLSTFHRPENVDDPHTLRTILDELARLPKPVVLPVHPRTAARASRDLATSKLLEELRVIDPLPYPAFLGLAAESAIMISDSGGVQGEASVLKRPILVVRRSTERPEVIGTFAGRRPGHRHHGDGLARRHLGRRLRLVEDRLHTGIEKLDPGRHPQPGGPSSVTEEVQRLRITKSAKLS